MKKTFIIAAVTLMTSLTFANDSMPSLKEDSSSRPTQKQSALKSEDSNERSLIKKASLSRALKSEDTSTLKQAPARTQREGLDDLKSELKLRGGGQVGNGGAGINRNGNYMTFYSAGIKINPRPKQINEIPTMDQLLDFFANTDVLRPWVAGTLLSLATPSDKHQYFDVDPAFFSKEVELRLRQEYAKLANIPLKAVSLFAITNPETKETYLLPSFYALKTDAEKMAILAHENMWLYCPECGYKDIVRFEERFQAHFENTADRQKAYALAASFGNDSSLRYAISADKQDGTLVDGTTIQNNNSSMQLSVVNLFGSSFINCALSASTLNDCRPHAMLRLSQLQRSYPDSLMIRWLAETNASNRLAVVPYYTEYSISINPVPQQWHELREIPFIAKNLPNMVFTVADKNISGDQKAIFTPEVRRFNTAGDRFQLSLVGTR